MTEPLEQAECSLPLRSALVCWTVSPQPLSLLPKLPLGSAAALNKSHRELDAYCNCVRIAAHPLLWLA